MDTRGLVYGVLAYVLWGLLPIYWKLLGSVPALEIICHRVVWSLAFTAALLGPGCGRVLRRCRDPRLALSMAVTALFLGVNWLLFVGSS